MGYKPTGRPVGRPLKDEPRWLTYSFKADPVLMEAAKEYAWQHRTSVGELLRDGLKWRLEEGDPLAYRYVASPPQKNNGNTTIPEKSTMPVPLDAADLEAMPLEPANGSAARGRQLAQRSAEPMVPGPDFDRTKYMLGSPCKKAGHQSHGEAGNLRKLVNGDCKACADAHDAAKKARPAAPRARG